MRCRTSRRHVCQSRARVACLPPDVGWNGGVVNSWRCSCPMLTEVVCYALDALLLLCVDFTLSCVAVAIAVVVFCLLCSDGTRFAKEETG